MRLPIEAGGAFISIFSFFAGPDDKSAVLDAPKDAVETNNIEKASTIILFMDNPFYCANYITKKDYLLAPRKQMTS
jgi:hypothetical protein